MSHVNARRLTERLCIIEAMRMVLLIGQPAGYTGNNQITIMLNGVLATELAPLGLERDKAKLYNRVRRVVRDVMAAEFLKEKAAITMFAMAVYHFMDNLLEQGLFPVEEGSDLEHCFEQILHRLSDFTGVEMNKFDEEAFEAGRRMLTNMQNDGYYQDVEWVTVFVPAGAPNAT